MVTGSAATCTRGKAFTLVHPSVREG